MGARELNVLCIYNEIQKNGAYLLSCLVQVSASLVEGLTLN